MVVNLVIGGVLLVGILIYWKGLRPWLKARREKNEKAERDAAHKAETARKSAALSKVMNFLSEEWISVEKLLEKIAEADGIAVSDLFQPSMFEGLEYGTSLRWVEKQGPSYRLTRLGSDKKAKKK